MSLAVRLLMVGSSASASARRGLRRLGLAGGGPAAESRPQPAWRAGGGGEGGGAGAGRTGGAGAGAGGGTGAGQALRRSTAAGSTAAIRAAGDEREILGQRRRNPRHLLAARGTGDADAGAVQRFLGHQVGDADFLEQFLHEQAVVAAIVGNHRRKRRRIHHQRAVRRDHRRQAGRKAAEPALERIAPGGVDQRDLDAGAAAVDLAQHGFEAEAVAADIRSRSRSAHRPGSCSSGGSTGRRSPRRRSARPSPA